MAPPTTLRATPATASTEEIRPPPEDLLQEISQGKTERFELCSKPQKGLQKHNI
jgi:hypothetical protein